MAFLKYGYAAVTNRSVDQNGWSIVKQASGSPNSFRKAASVLDKYPPQQYLLTHATIVASVDTEEAPNVKTGKVEENGIVVNRPYSNYYITPETSHYVNQNNDAFERQLLLNTFRTFIGASNYLEHVQVPELSKGKVIDAAARDLGDTIYVDILVATDRKHEQLIKDIESGKLNALSMGCKIAYSQCSKCGNVASDETELCKHVKYEKGKTFIDSNGKERVIAELCGHHEDLESVTFIEASWVANPAFKGAVVRNLLNPSEQISSAAKQAMERFRDAVASSDLLAEFLAADNIDRLIQADATEEEMNALRNMHDNMRQMFASLDKKAFGGFGDDDDDEEDTPPIQEVKDDVKKHLQESIKKELIDEMQEELGLDDKEPMFNDPSDIENLNNNIVASYQAFSNRYAKELPDNETLRRVFNVIKVASDTGWPSVKLLKEATNRDIITAMYLKDRDFGEKAYPQDVYTCLLKVGGQQNYKNVDTFLNACELALKSNNKQASINNNLASLLIKRSKYLK